MLDFQTIDCIKSVYKLKKYIKNPTCYFYDLSIIKKNIGNLEEYMPEQIRLYYAMKANSNVYVMKCICENNFVSGLEIASSGELITALQYRNAADIIFTGPGKTDYELEESIKSGIRFINIESVAEAVRIQNIAVQLGIDKIDILIRINLNYSVLDGMEQMSGCSTKMGIDEDDCLESITFIQKLDRICIKGVHVFAASGVLSYKSLLKSNQYIFSFVKRIETIIGEISVIDFGGGLGIDYTNKNEVFDIGKYGRELANLISEFGFCEKEIIMELGTYLVGNAGYYTAKIIDIKKNKGHYHIILAGGVNHMGLPLEMRRKHPIHIIDMAEKDLYEGQPAVIHDYADISGPLCMVTDKLCWDEYIDKARIGDIVVFRQSGAYCYGEGMHDFLKHFYSDELIIDEKRKVLNLER